MNYSFIYILKCYKEKKKSRKGWNFKSLPAADWPPVRCWWTWWRWGSQWGWHQLAALPPDTPTNTPQSPGSETPGTGNNTKTGKTRWKSQWFTHRISKFHLLSKNSRISLLYYNNTEVLGFFKIQNHQSTSKFTLTGKITPPPPLIQDEAILWVKLKEVINTLLTLLPYA